MRRREAGASANLQETDEQEQDINIVTSSSESSIGYQNEVFQTGPSATNEGSLVEGISKRKRFKWTKEELRDIEWCYQYCKLKNCLHYLEIYKLWRQRNPNTRPHIDANKLQNQRRYMIAAKKLTPEEINSITQQVQSVLQADSISEENDRPATSAELQIENSLLTNVPQIEGNQESDHNFNIQNEIQQPAVVHNEHHLENNHESDEILTIQKEIQEKIASIQILPINERPKLPKITLNSDTKKIINNVNSAVRNILNSLDQIDIQKINSLIYSSAFIYRTH